MKGYAYVSFHFFQASQPRVWTLSCDALITYSGINIDFHSVPLLFFFSPLLLELGPSFQCSLLIPLVIIKAGHSFACLTSIVFTNIHYVYQAAAPCESWFFWCAVLKMTLLIVSRKCLCKRHLHINVFVKGICLFWRFILLNFEVNFKVFMCLNLRI